SGGRGRGGWRTLSGVQWRERQRGVEDTEWRGWRTLSGGQWRERQRGVEDTEWSPVEGLAEGGGGH
ncbi:unnamed protein product, partial [Staurois parvus]